MKRQHSKNKTAYLFNVDILVEGETNAVALEKLLNVLNGGNFPDYRIVSGLEMGTLIANMRESAAEFRPIPVKAAAGNAAPPSGGTQAAKTKTDADQSRDPNGDPSINERIRRCIEAKRLIRLSVNKGYGIRLSIPCRILNFDETAQLLTVYHVDEKQVYAFNLYEIDEFSE
jgi:hypothetical protein